jgi:hypothetical protein
MPGVEMMDAQHCTVNIFYAVCHSERLPIW